MVSDLKKTKNFGLPVFPWDTISDITALAHSHPGGALDLTIGSPADSVAPGVQAALAQAADSHGYPAAVGTGQLREAIAEYMQQVRGTVPLTADQVLLTVGSKELVASLPFQLGLGSDHILPTRSVPFWRGQNRCACPKIPPGGRRARRRRRWCGSTVPVIPTGTPMT